jgi:AraC-like DNA-binding protein
MFDPDKLLRLNHHVSLNQPIVLKKAKYLQSEGPTFHMHYETELAVLLNGRIRRLFKDVEFDCTPGDIWFTGIWEPHGYIVKKEPCSSIVFITSPELLKNLHFPEEKTFDALAPYMESAEKRPIVTKNNREKISEIAKKAVSLSKSHIQHKNLRARILFLELLLSVCENPDQLMRRKHHSNNDFNVVNNAVNIVFSDRSFLPVEKISSNCGMNKSSFSRLFKQVMGIGFAQFALRFRLSCVANELITTDLPIKTLTFKWGFSDISHMHRLFQEHYGYSPSKYRSQIKNSEFNGNYSYHL